MKFDLHTHSHFSDGSDSPYMIVKKAKELGITVALTDHNSVEGLDEFVFAGKEYGVDVVPGVEFSTDYGEKEIHIIALFIDEEHYDTVRQLTAFADTLKEESNVILAANLNKNGYEVDYEEIRETTNDGRVNRVHFAKYLVDKKYVSSINEAFETLISKKSGNYIPPKRLDVFDTIGYIRMMNAVPIIAHAPLNLTIDELTGFLPKAKDHGLIGIETCYSLYNDDTSLKMKLLAKKFDLLESSGSDYHGTSKPDISLGMMNMEGISPCDFDKLKNSISK
ncbi:MAG TPA: PHP domain-containing protein [Clostridiales bacterium]|nr:PHP domain-containing protein [Clostridiales bacterium]